MEEVKVVFLGDDSRGAEKVIAYLKSNDDLCQQTPSKAFDGFDATLTLGVRDLRIHFWNLCQSHVPSPLHRLFMTGHTIYVVMADAENDREKYWLNEINWYAPDSQVLTIYNQTAHLLQTEESLEAFVRICPALLRRIRLDVHIGDKDAIRNKFWIPLVCSIQDIAARRAAVPESWYHVRKQLDILERDYISGEVFRMICSQWGVDGNEEIRKLTAWLNEWGVCFGGTDAKQDLVVLRSRWLIKGASALLFREDSGRINGNYTLKELLRMRKVSLRQRLMGQKEYEIQELSFILSALCNVDVCIRHHENDGVFIPIHAAYREQLSLGDRELPVLRMDWHGPSELILHRLMARMERSVIWEYCARNRAVVIHKMGTHIGIEARGELLYFFVDCPGAEKDYLEALERIIQVLDDLCVRQRLHMPELMIVYRDGDKEELFDFDRLMFIKENGSGAVYSSVLGRAIDVDDILQLPRHQKQHKHKLCQTVANACTQMQSDRCGQRRKISANVS